MSLVVLTLLLVFVWLIYKWASAAAARDSGAQAVRFSDIPRSDDEYESVRRVHTKVKGVTKEGRQYLIRSRCRAGDLLWFFHEPNNPKDVNAIQVRRVVKDGQQHPRMSEQLGYLSRELAAEIAPLLDQGMMAIGQIAQITGGEPGRPSIGLNIEIYLYRRIATVAVRRPS
jgi:hypothetical protein